ncbi:MAG: hypothetical protein JEZ09_03485 [Salinivirgaceae bacterium]|nr:hypothetical protein [Salinivirgaceae bacterium]
MKKFILLFSIAVFLFSTGCVEKNYYDSEGLEETSIARTVSNNPVATFSFEQVTEMQKGTKMYLRVNRTGFSVEEHMIVFEGTLEDAGERLIVCKTLNGLKIGQGDSGSPILTADGKVAGVLCYGFNANSTQFIARAIEDVLSINNNNKSLNRNLNSNYYKIEPYFYMSGITGDMPKYVKKGVNLVDIPVQNNSLKSTSDKLSEPASLISGMSISASIIQGDVINYGAVGTASYIKDEMIYAFGHPFMNKDPYGTPVFYADMITLIESNGDYPSYKLSAPTDYFIGIIVEDKTEGILITTDDEPSFIESQHNIDINNGDETYLVKHKISKQEDIYYEIYYVCLTSAIAIDAYAPSNSYNYASGTSTVVITFDDSDEITLIFTTYDTYDYDSEFFSWLDEQLYNNYYDKRIKDISINSKMTYE